MIVKAEPYIQADLVFKVCSVPWFNRMKTTFHLRRQVRFLALVSTFLMCTVLSNPPCSRTSQLFLTFAAAASLHSSLSAINKTLKASHSFAASVYGFLIMTIITIQTQTVKWGESLNHILSVLSCNLCPPTAGQIAPKRFLFWLLEAVTVWKRIPLLLDLGEMRLTQQVDACIYLWDDQRRDFQASTMILAKAGLERGGAARLQQAASSQGCFLRHTKPHPCYSAWTRTNGAAA